MHMWGYLHLQCEAVDLLFTLFASRTTDKCAEVLLLRKLLVIAYEKQKIKSFFFGSSCMTFTFPFFKFPLS